MSGFLEIALTCNKDVVHNGLVQVQQFNFISKLHDLLFLNQKK